MISQRNGPDQAYTFIPRRTFPGNFQIYLQSKPLIYLHQSPQIHEGFIVDKLAIAV